MKNIMNIMTTTDNTMEQLEDLFHNKLDWEKQITEYCKFFVKYSQAQYNNMDKKTLVINLFGGPGTGKSTGSAYIFSQLKLAGIDVEYVSEFAKDKVWEKNDEVFKCQEYIFGKQSFKMNRCRGKVDVIVTDSPLLLSSYYNKDLSENFDKLVFEIFNTYDNVNFLIKRSKPYNPNGRFQTEKESDKIGEELIELLDSHNVKYLVTYGDIAGYDNIVKYVLGVLKN